MFAGTPFFSLNLNFDVVSPENVSLSEDHLLKMLESSFTEAGGNTWNPLTPKESRIPSIPDSGIET
jgi:hypothetical protein